MYRGSLGVQIGNKHTLRTGGLGWTKVTLGFPEAKTYEHGYFRELDGDVKILRNRLTGGDVKYKIRTLTLEFETPEQDYYDWGIRISEIANYLAGRKYKIILDNDPDFYYIGRLNVEVEKLRQGRRNSYLVWER